jgi:hypothetical protein
MLVMIAWKRPQEPTVHSTPCPPNQLDVVAVGEGSLKDLAYVDKAKRPYPSSAYPISAAWPSVLATWAVQPAAE